MGSVNTIESYYDIQYKRFGQERPAGAGSYGEVRACTHLETHKLRAVKAIDKKEWGARGRIMREIGILTRVAGRHRNVIEFVEYYEEWSVMHLVFEFCPNGSVQAQLDRGELGRSESSARPIAAALLAALAFLREEGVVHRDVKPDNMLLDRDSVPKLADFGTAISTSEDEHLRQVEGTPAYLAPEQLQLPRGDGYSFPVDAWAAGIVTYMLLFKGAHPFNEGKGINQQLLRAGLFSTGWLTSSSASDLLRWLLSPHPSQRVLPKEALCHQWLSSEGLGKGQFARQRTSTKLILDSHGNWLKTR